jgi:hemolysin activation/secretion protein
MPTLGGGDFLRGYRTYRFRDRDALVLTAQVQWRVHEYADAAVFVDAGSVAPRVSALSLRAIPLTEGIGIRVHTPKRTIFRMDLARSVEGFQLLIGFSSRASAVF